MFGWFRKQEPAGLESIDGIMVNLLVGGEQALFLMLGSDGSATRAGTGSVDNTHRDMFISRETPHMFEKLRARITAELLEWCGSERSAPNPKGRLCELTVGFRLSDGSEQASVWRYGSESQGPPPEVAEWVAAAVEVTDSWFARQQSMTQRDPGA